MWLTLVLVSLTLNSVCSNPSADLCSICGRPSPTVRHQVPADHVADSGPWAVSLKIDQRYSCSGSIIGLTHVLTSAHCFQHLLPASPAELASRLEVRAGSIRVGPEAVHVARAPKAVLLYPTYEMANTSDPHSSTLDDLAIIRLKQRSRATVFVNCVHKPQGERTVPSQDLMQAELTVFSEPKCRKIYAKKKIRVNDRHICVKSGEDLSTTCPGDSGGILGVNVNVYDEDRLFLVGLTSFGGPDDQLYLEYTDDRLSYNLIIDKAMAKRTSYPAVFTRVHSYLYWISRVTGIVACDYELIEKIEVNYVDTE